MTTRVIECSLCEGLGWFFHSCNCAHCETKRERCEDCNGTGQALQLVDERDNAEVV